MAERCLQLWSCDVRASYGEAALREVGRYIHIYIMCMSVLHCLLPWWTCGCNSSARPRGTQHLARWAISRLYDIDALSKMVDPSLNGLYPVKSLSRFADIISRCIQVNFSHLQTSYLGSWTATLTLHFSHFPSSGRAGVSASDVRGCPGPGACGLKKSNLHRSELDRERQKFLDLSKVIQIELAWTYTGCVSSNMLRLCTWVLLGRDQDSI